MSATDRYSGTGDVDVDVDGGAGARDGLAGGDEAARGTVAIRMD